jgi:D-alanyl-D-alanine carboxypeptidase
LPQASAYVLVDVGTGNVLAGQDEDLRLPPASLTKVLTALVAVTYLPQDALVTGTRISENAYPNRVGMEIGRPWPLNDTLHALLVMSANDAAYAIAGRISGSVTAFGAVMERSAAQIGMTDHPVFHDPAGLDGTEGVGGGNLVSARDLAIAGRDLLSVPELAGIVKEKTYYFVDPEGEAHYLAGTNSYFMYGYSGAVGIKTGFTDRAGQCIMAAATRDGRTMLAVVLNGYNPTQSAIDLLNQGFATPAFSEPTADHLPAVTLPSRPPAPGPRARSHEAPPLTRSATPGVRRHGAGAAGRDAQTTSKPSPWDGVIGSWPGQALLVATVVASLMALSELLRARQLRQRYRRARARLLLAPYGRTGAQLVVGPLGSQRRREQPPGHVFSQGPRRL